MAAGLKKRGKRRLMGEINVVPYIDVMLVLLIIFMVTAPLLTQGVKIELPEATTETLPPEDSNPITLTVTAAGELILEGIGPSPGKPVEDEVIVATVSSVLRNRPETPVMIRGDRNADYGSIMHGMSLLKQAGVPSIGMISDPVKSAPANRSGGGG